MLPQFTDLRSRLVQALINPPLTGVAVVLVLLAGLRLVNLSADFPVGISAPGLAYTDEGWWSRNALSLIRDGHWYIDDGYNTVFSLPVLPLLQAGWFKIFGVSLTAARSLTVLCLVVVSGLVYAIARREIKSGLAWLAPFIVLSSYPVFAYSRLALLEMPMLVTILISLWLVITADDRQATRLAKIVSSASFFALAVLTKTTALFALPMLAVLIYLPPGKLPSGKHWFSRRRLQSVATWLLVFAVPTGLFYWFVSNGNNALSYSYFEDFNVIEKTHKGLFSVMKGPLRVLKYSFGLFPLLLTCLSISLATLIRSVKYRSNKAFQIALLWSFSVLVMFSISNFAAPRYFLIWIVPVALAVPLVIEYFLTEHSLRVASWRKTLFLSVFLLSTVVSLSRIGVYLSTPKFTLINATKDVEATIAADPTHSPVVMGHFADTLALADDNIKAINDQMGFRDLDYRIKTFKPGYYISIGEVNPHIASKLQAYYQLELLKTFDLYQNYDYGKPVFFYRLIP